MADERRPPADALRPGLAATVALAAGLATIGLGVAVGAGWFLRNDTLLQLRPGWVAMQFNTALGIALGGAGLVAGARRRPAVAAAAGVAVLLVGGLTLVEYLVGWNLGIDELFVRAYNTVEASSPGRMAPNAAVALILVGVALVGVARRVPPWVLSTFSLLTAAFGVLALFGYAAGVPTAYGWGGWTRMAVHTAAGLIVLGAGGYGLARSSEHRPDPPHRIALPIGFGVLTVLLGAWAAVVRLRPDGGLRSAATTQVVLLTALTVAGGVAAGVAWWVARRLRDEADLTATRAARRLRLSVSRHATTALLLVTLLPVGLVAGVVYVQQRGTIRQDVVARLEGVAQVQADRLEELVGHALDEHALVAARPSLRAALQEGAPDSTLARMLDESVGTDRDVRAATLFTLGGRLLASAGLGPDTVDWQPDYAGVNTGLDFALEDAGRPQLALREFVYGPVTATDGRRLAVLVLERDPGDLLAVASDHTGLGDTGETVIGFRDHEGQARFIAPRRLSNAGPLTPIADQDLDATLPIERALAGHQEVDTDARDYRGERVVAATRYLGLPGWGLVTKIDHGEAYAPLSSLERSLLLGGSLTGLAAGLVALLLGAAIRNAERSLRSSQERLAGVLDAAPVGVTFVDPDGTIAFANPRAESTLGLRANDASRRSYDDPDWHITTLEGGPFPAQQLPVARVLRTGTPVTDVRHAIQRPDGTTVALSVAAAPVRDEDDAVGVVAVFTDITDQLAAQRSQALLAAIVEHADDPIVSLSHDGTIVSWNDAAERAFGYTATEVVGEPITVIVPPDKRDELRELHARVHAGESLRNVETARVDRTGRRFPVSLTLSPIRDATGRIVGLSGIERDITDQVRDREQLERYAAELEQFAYVAAHDLQEPLRMVASFTELLARRYRGQLDDEADEFIEYAVGGAHRIQQALNELLAYVTANTGAPLAPVDTRRLVDAAISAMRPELHRTQAQVEVGPLPTVAADETQLLRVFHNLLSNAIKFRGEEPPHIRVTAHEEPGEWVFAVSDNGIGIAEEHLDRLFALFRRLHTRIEYPGSGLGLAISKKIVERHGGRIWIASELGRGTTVRFTIPHRQEHDRV